MTLRYQLLVRAAAAIGEATSAGAPRALLLVHSFDAQARGYDDFVGFAAAIGTIVTVFGQLSAPVQRGGVSLQLGWVRDRARS